MTDPMTVIDPAHGREQEGLWTRRLVLFLRIVAGLSLVKGLYHWAGIAGIGAPPGEAFDANPLPWQAATVFFAVIDLVHATTGRRAFVAAGFREPIEAVEGYITERITTVNLSYIIRTVRAVAARNGLVGFDAPFMYAPTSPEYAVVMAPYAEATSSDVVAESEMRKAEATARRAGMQSRGLAMGGSTSVGGRRAPEAA